MVCAERTPPRDQYIVTEELERLVSPDFHPKIWELIRELERGAWESGADEGWCMALAEHR